MYRYFKKTFWSKKQIVNILHWVRINVVSLFYHSTPTQTAQISHDTIASTLPQNIYSWKELEPFHTQRLTFACSVVMYKSIPYSLHCIPHSSAICNGSPGIFALIAKKLEKLEWQKKIFLSPHWGRGINNGEYIDERAFLNLSQAEGKLCFW